MPKHKKDKKEKKEQKEEDAGSSGDQNEYQKDGFVVDSASDEDGEEQNNDDEEYNSLDLSEDDYQLIEENERTKPGKRGRLTRNVDSSIEEEASIVEEERVVEDVAEEEEVPGDQQQVLEELFDPTQRQQDYLEDQDEKICALDIPERIQMLHIRVLGRLPEPVQTQEQLPQDSDLVSFVERRLLSERVVPIRQSEQEAYREGVRTILEHYKCDYMEAYAVYTYKKHLITNVITLDEYWRIQELEVEYILFSQQREQLKQKLAKLRATAVEFKISPLIDEMLNQALKQQQLTDISEYLQYLELKAKCKKMSFDMKTKGEKLSQATSSNKLEMNLLKSMYYRIDELAPQLAYTVDEFADILSGRPTSTYKRETLTVSDITPWVDPTCLEVSEIKQVILVLQDYIVTEFYKHPFIRQYVGNEYNRYAQISTEPTAQGNKELNVLSYLYPVKRIKNRPIKYMEDETYFMLKQALELGYIKSTVKIQEHNTKNESRSLKQDEVVANISAKFRLFGDRHHGDKTNKEDTLRDYLMNTILGKLYPLFEKRLHEYLEEQATLQVLRYCAKEFKNMINQPPHQTEQDGEEQDKKIMSLVLAYDESVQQNDLAKTYTQDNQLQKKHTAMVVVDRKGEVVTKGVFNYVNNKVQRADWDALRQQEKAQLDMVFAQYEPDLIVISANQPECIRIRTELRDQYKDSKHWISVADTTVPHIYSLTERSQQQLPEVPVILREAVSLARLKLNPLAEVLNVWNDNYELNGCIHIQYHPLQRMVPSWRLHNELQKVAVEVVNAVGVDIIDAALHPHLSNQVQFLCGLGPRKAKRFIWSVKAKLSKIYTDTQYESEKRILLMMKESTQPIKFERIDILKLSMLGRNVFKNIQGFVKIMKGVCHFDRTRLITQQYNDAYYIAKSALDIEQGQNDRDYSILVQLQKQPQKLDDLELDDWAIQKEQKEKLKNYKEVVKFMTQELVKPFEYKYDRGGEMSNKEIFYKVTQESPNTFKKHSIVTGPIIWIKNDILCIRISDAGLTGTLHKKETQVDPNKSYNQEFSEGQVVKAFVKSIEALEDSSKRPSTNKDQQSKNVNIFRVELTLRPQWQPVLDDSIVVVKPDLWNKSYSYREYESRVKQTFDVDEARRHDLPSIQLANKDQQVQKLVIRKINHPKFKQVMLKGATDYIESQKVGDYIIRPSSRGKEYLTITWKFYEGVIVHLQVREEHRQDNYKPKLVLGKDEFENFDEVYERYLVPCNNHMEAVTNNKKFSQENMDVMEKRLKDEKEKDHSLVPYGFCVTEKAPQFIVLIYYPREKAEKEFIKVKPEGLSFHGVIYSTLKDVITFFKQNFRTVEYKNYMKKTKPPFVETDKLQIHNQNWDIKREKKDEKIKYEGQDKSQFTCTRCGNRGHAAMDCREKAVTSRRSDSRSRQDSRRGNTGGGQMACFHCQEPGHQKKNCPQLGSGRLSNRDQPSAYQHSEGGWNTGSAYQRERSMSRDRHNY